MEGHDNPGSDLRFDAYKASSTDYHYLLDINLPEELSPITACILV